MAARITPLVVVLGATGAGKSKLALEIAKIFNGEIISADSMQIYKGLDIITNKVTEEEQRECRHHLISYLEPSSQNNTVVDFRNRALPIMEDLLHRKKMPVIVGGTNYYIESLLWEFLVDAKNADVSSSSSSSSQAVSDSTTTRDNVGPTKSSCPSAGIDSSGDGHTSHNLDEEPSPTKKIKLTSSHAVEEDIDSRGQSCISGSDGVNPKKSSDHALPRVGEVSPTSLETHCASSNPESGHNQNQNSSFLESTSGTATQADVAASFRRRSTSSPRSKTRQPRSPDAVEGGGQGDLGDSVGGVCGVISRDADDGPPSREEKPLLAWLNGQTTVELYDRLQLLDPDTAHRHHPHNRRKILRSLQVFYQTGTTMSEFLKEQHKGQGQGQVKSGPLRYPRPCILWVKCERQVLDQRLDERVDAMLARGLLKELEDFNTEAQRLAQRGDEAANSPSQEYPHGILQMIGFKEFHSYLQLSKEDRQTQQGQELFHKGVEDLKSVTRRYARRQERWIRNRFCSRPGPNVPPVYAVDSTDVTQWNASVKDAIETVTAFTEGREPDKEPEPSVHSDIHDFERNVCHVCDGKVFLDPVSWKAHLKTKKHRYNQKQLSKKHKELSGVLSSRKQQLENTVEQPHNIEKKGDGDLSHSSDGGDGQLASIEVAIPGGGDKDV